MDQADGMCSRQATGDLLTESKDIRHFEWTSSLNSLLHGLAGNVFHDQVWRRRLVHGINLDHMFVSNSSGCASLAQKSLSRG